MQKKQKKTRAKAKNVTQTVIVNVGKKRSAPTGPTIPKPTPLQQATQFIQSAGPLIRPADSMFQSVQLMQRLIEPTTLKINQLQEAIAKLQPAKQEPQQAVSLPVKPVVEVSVPVKPLPEKPVIDVSIPVKPRVIPNIPFIPPNSQEQQNISFANMNVNQLYEIVEKFPQQAIPLPSKPRESVLDQPDEQLVTPSKPLVPAGPQRLDDPHEDVPIKQIEYVAEEKQEASRASSSDEINPPGDFDYESLTLEDLQKLQVERRTAKGPSLREIAVYFGLTPGRKYKTKSALIELIASNRGLN